ncbi:MAG: SulP family inorganic anion transporter [Opitutales bacterium]
MLTRLARNSKVFVPIAGAASRYRLKQLRSDLIAGASVSIITMPQAVGFALIAGLPPQMVLYGAIVGGFFAAFFCSSRQLITGPTNTISLVLAGTVVALEPIELNVVEGALLMAVMIGLFQILAGVSQVGGVTRFISRSVIIGYSAGVGLLIIVGQLNNLFGIEPVRGLPLFDSLRYTFTNLFWFRQFNIPTAMIGIASIAAIVLIRYYRPRLPDGLTVMVVSGAMAFFFSLENLGVSLIRHVGEIVPGIPTPEVIPVMTNLLDFGGGLTSMALAIAILGMLETVAISKNISANTGQKVKPNQDLLGLGVGNFMSGIFGGMPGSGSFVRSAMNYQTGATSQMAALISSLVLFSILLLFAPMVNYVPISALAGLLIVVAYKMINLEHIRIAVFSTRSDGFVFLATFLSTIFLSLDTAIYVGIGTSLVLFLRKAGSPFLVEYGFNERGALSELGKNEKRHNDQISIIHVEGELFFGAADVFQEQIRRIAEDEDIRVFILRLKNARHLDATSVMALQQLNDYLQKTGRHLIISGVTDDVKRVLKNSGLVNKIGEGNVFETELNPTMSTKRALLRASHLLQLSSPDIRLFYNRERARGKDKEVGPAEDESDLNYSI